MPKLPTEASVVQEGKDIKAGDVQTWKDKNTVRYPD